MDQHEILLRNSSLSKPSIDIDEEKERHGTENYEAIETLDACYETL